VPDQQPLSNRLTTTLMVTLLLIGLYFPTSFRETISTGLYLACAATMSLILLLLLLRRRGILRGFSIVNAAAINVILVVCTLFSPLTEFAYGGWVPIFLFSVLFCLALGDIGLTTATRRLFDIANIVNIICAALLLLRVPGLTQFFLDNYAFAYDNLLPYMLAEGKPVLTFGSHSLAGFFFYLLFYLTFQTFVVTHSKLNLVFAVGYLALLTFLYSFTALVFAVVASAQLVGHFQWRKSLVAGLLATALLAVAAVVVPRLDAVDNLKEDLIEVMNREDNGLLGRYSSYGGLSANLAYIAEHPFQPIGMGYSSQLWYADSGPVGYLLKGSFPLLCAVYTGALLFFYQNLKSRRRAIFLFVVFLGFEVGYSNLEYIRTQCFLPFMVVYLNGLDAAGNSPELKYA
jgi:hypothetical protein